MSKIFTSFLVFLLLTTGKSISQVYISGKVTDTNLQPISYVSVHNKQLQTGTTTDQDGNYKIQVNKGSNQLIFSIVGFKPQVINLDVTGPFIQNIILEDENRELSEVLVVVTKKDRAEEIIKNVIRQKQSFLSAPQSFSCTVYIKATEENDAISKSINVYSKPIKKDDDLSNMGMAEIIIRLDHANPDKIKEERTAIKFRGSTNDLFYLTTTTGDFNFYRNLVKAPSVTTIPMLSPISYSGLVAYKFKTLNIRKENGRKIYTIKVTPSQSGNALVEGEIEVMDSTWALVNTHFQFPEHQLIYYDDFSVDQHYEKINNAWVPVRQEFNYLVKTKHTKTRGKTTADYFNYAIDTTFSKNYFGPEVSSTADDAPDKNEEFWDSVRKETLSEKESRFIEHSDSSFRITHSKAYLDSLDRDFNKITFSKVVFFGQGIYNRNKERTITLPPLINVIKPFQLGGVRIAADASYSKIYPSKKTLNLKADLSYGIRNRDLKGRISINRLYDPFHWKYFIINAGREFSMIYGDDSWVSGFKRSNIYEKYDVTFEHGMEVFNGFYFSENFEFAHRNSVENYKFNTKFDTLFRGLTNNTPIAFDPYNAIYNNITLSYTPHQRYIREQKQKVYLGSSWPTFAVTWRKGLPGILDSKIDFDYLEFTIKQKLKLGLAGIAEYSLISGGFINTNKLGIVDYKYMRRGDPLLFTEPSRNFQALDSTFPVFKRFYEGHFIHNFNGVILNQIPGFKKLNINEIAGGGVLYLPEKDLRYAEMYAGLEKVLHIFNEKVKIGAFVVGSVANKFNKPIQFKIALQYFNRTSKTWH